MTQENRNLLLKDLCGRLPYGVKANVSGWDEEKQEEVNIPLRVYSIDTDGYLHFESNDYGVDYYGIEHCALFLRPMSSMTEEEKEILKGKCFHTETEEDWEGIRCDSWGIEILSKYDTKRWDNHIWPSTINMDAIDWLNKKMFDYRGLIPKGLANEAKEGMYNS